jgi:hypothetical protein
MFAFSNTICDAVQHYIDGTFIFTLCMLLSVMMVYKYWDCEYQECEFEGSLLTNTLSYV